MMQEVIITSDDVFKELQFDALNCFLISDAVPEGIVVGYATHESES